LLDELALTSDGDSRSASVVPAEEEGSTSSVRTSASAYCATSTSRSLSP